MNDDTQGGRKIVIDPKDVRVDIPDDLRVAPYSSLVWINNTGQDYLLSFAQVVPITNVLNEQPTQAEAHVVARVIMTQQTAVQLHTILEDQLKQAGIPITTKPQ